MATKRQLHNPDGSLTNPKHEIYAQQRALGFSMRDAYKTANPGAKHATPGSLYNSAQQVDARPEVRERIAAVQHDLLKSSDALLSKRALGEMMADEIRHMAQDVGGLTAAKGLIDTYCKMFGLYEPDKAELRIGAADGDAVATKLAQLLGPKKQ